MTNRSAQIEAFLKQSGLEGAERKAVSGDASFRRYERIFSGNKSYILMDAPPDKEDVKPFVKIAQHLTQHGFSAPDIIKSDIENGFLLLEDLGDDLYSRYLGIAPSAAEEVKLYEKAIDTLIELHKKPLPANLAPYDTALYLRESMLFQDWFIKGVMGEESANKLRGEFEKLIVSLLEKNFLPQNILVLRDYHADNLLWLDEREGTKKVGLLDFQDAVSGSAEYDLVSLIEDARRDLLPQTPRRLLDYYAAAAKTESKDEFLQRYYLLGAQRNLKIIGIFHRLNLRDGKPNYLKFLPRVWRHLEKDLEHSYLSPLKDWLDKNIPAELRK